MQGVPSGGLVKPRYLLAVEIVFEGERTIFEIDGGAGREVDEGYGFAL